MRSYPVRGGDSAFHIVKEKALAEEARRYGTAGAQPQVIWPNGVLASSAVGLVMQLIAPWHDAPVDAACLEYDGNSEAVTPSDRLRITRDRELTHYPLANAEIHRSTSVISSRLSLWQPIAIHQL